MSYSYDPQPQYQQNDPYGSQQYGNEPYGQQQYGNEPYGQPQYANDPYGQQNAYAANPYAGQAGGVQAYNPYAIAQLPDHPQSTTVLVLGILSIVGISICGPFAWFMGNKARKEIRENPGRYKESGQLTAGWVMGIIGTVLLIVGVLFTILYFIILFAAIASTGHS